jgi:3-methylcrotonyl-CoA carboxylase beta subunit
MSVIASQIDLRSPDYQASHARLQALVNDLREQLARAGNGGGEEARGKHAARRKQLPPERIRALLDPGTPFLEF